jgi:dihydroxyacetone kinase
MGLTCSDNYPNGGGVPMAHIFNDPKAFYREMLDGFLLAYERYVERVPGASGVMRRGGPVPGRVSVVIGGGSGHYPAFAGLVGPGLAHGAVLGDIFTSPSTEQVYRVGRALDGGAGVLFSFGNYAGDVMNFGAAQDRLRAEGIECRTVLVTDDIASAPADDKSRRRGVAGDFAVFKIAGAAADRGDPIGEVERLAIRTNGVTSSLGIAFAGCTFPGRSEPLFTVAPGTMDVGLGIHGEPGVETVEAMPAADLARVLVEDLLVERPPDASRAAVILNGLGSTKYEELFVLFSSIAPLLDGAGVEVIMPEVGELVTSLDMAGCSLTFTWLDDELEELWRAPADSPAFRRDTGSVRRSPVETASPALAPSRSADTEESVPTATAEAGSDLDEATLQASETIRKVLIALRDLADGRQDEWGRLDSVAGDGDHGIGMLRGLQGAVDGATANVGGPAAVLRVAADMFADRAGGSSGALWGAFLGGVAAGLPLSRRPGPAEVAAAMSAGAGALQQLGKCNIGDKTMYDALGPFVDELSTRVESGENLVTAWRAAADVALARAAATADLMPRLGRARPLGERSLGTPDPGAVSMAECLAAVVPVLEEAADASGH